MSSFRAAPVWDVFMPPTVEEQSSKAAPVGTAAGPWGTPGTCSPGAGNNGDTAESRKDEQLSERMRTTISRLEIQTTGPSS